MPTTYAVRFSERYQGNAVVTVDPVTGKDHQVYDSDGLPVLYRNHGDAAAWIRNKTQGS